MNKLQMYRSHQTHRTNSAWWDAKQQVSGEWKVHFHADRVPSTDWIAFTEAEMFEKIQEELASWITVLERNYIALQAEWSKQT